MWCHLPFLLGLLLFLWNGTVHVVTVHPRSNVVNQQGVHRASRLPSMMPGLGLMPARSNLLTKPAAFPVQCRASALCRLGRPPYRASHLPSMMLGLGLTLVLTKTNTGVQISLLLVRKPLLPGECYSSQLKGSRTSPQMLCPESESPKLRE